MLIILFIICWFSFLFESSQMNISLLLEIVIFKLPRNKKCFIVTDTLNRILSADLNPFDAESAKQVSMIMPQVIFAKKQNKR